MNGTMNIIHRAADPTKGIKEIAHAEIAMRAWEPGKALDKMEKVVWAQVDEIQVNGKAQAIMKWIKLGSTDWNSGKNIWDSSLQSWIDYVRS